MKFPSTRRPALALAAATALLAACSTAPQLAYSVPDQPEGSSGYTEKPGWATRQFDINRSELSSRPGRQVGFGNGGRIARRREDEEIPF